MINITTAATEKVKAVLEQEKANLPQGGLRIYVQGGGCSGFQYGMVLDEVTDGDEVFEKDGIKVIVDPMSMRYLEGAEVDYKEDLMGGGFAIKNSNATSTCGCGHSFQAGSEGGEPTPDTDTATSTERFPGWPMTSGPPGEERDRRRASLTRAPQKGHP